MVALKECPPNSKNLLCMLMDGASIFSTTAHISLRASSVAFLGGMISCPSVANGSGNAASSILPLMVRGMSLIWMRYCGTMYGGNSVDRNSVRALVAISSRPVKYAANRPSPSWLFRTTTTALFMAGNRLMAPEISVNSMR